MKNYLAAAAFVLLATSALAQDAMIPPEPLTPVAQWFQGDVYPAASMRANEEGDVSAFLSIDPQGMVSGCRVTHSSGHPLLDRATCALAVRRGRFVPAKDAQRRPTDGSYVISDLKWRIKGIEAPSGGPPIVAVSPPASAPGAAGSDDGSPRDPALAAAASLASLSGPPLPATLPITPQRLHVAAPLWTALDMEPGIRATAAVQYPSLLKQVTGGTATLPAVMQTRAKDELHAAFEAALDRHVALERDHMVRYFAARLDDHAIRIILAYLSSDIGYKMVHDAGRMTATDRQDVGRANLNHPEIARLAKVQMDFAQATVADRTTDTKLFYADVHTNFCRAIANERFVFSSCPARKH